MKKTDDFTATVPWTTPTVWPPPRVNWKHYALAFQVSEDLYWPKVSEVVSDQIEIAADHLNQMLARDLFGPHQPPAPKTRRERLRSWLGLRLWRAATWLDPDLCD